MSEEKDTPWAAGEGEIPVPGYLFRIRELLRDGWPDVWDWFGSKSLSGRTSKLVQLDLLKSAVLVDRKTEPYFYQLADQASRRLKLDLPISIYAANQTGPLNASVCSDPNHAHLILSGDFRRLLSDSEILAVLAHEMGHQLLWQHEEKDFYRASQILSAMANDPSAKAIYHQTLSNFNQYCEIFCDRAAFAVVNEIEPVVTSLVKTVTGVKQVDVGTYLKQVDTIEELDDRKTASLLNHPQLHIRAQALCWYLKDPEKIDDRLSESIQGELSLESLDLSHQADCRDLVHQVLQDFLSPVWTRVDENLTHAKLFFEDFEFSAEAGHQWVDLVVDAGHEFKKTIGYVLLDFVTVDRDAMEPMLARAIAFAERFGFAEPFVALARKELRLRKKQVRQIQQDSDRLIAELDREKSGADVSASQTTESEK